MATDEEYMDFLNKANEDPNPPSEMEAGSGKVKLRCLDGGEEEVPVGLRSLLKGGKDEVFLESEADEVFEGVSLEFGGKNLPDEGAFTKLVHHPSADKAEISIMDVQEWDKRGDYKKLVEKIREAVKGSDVRVYRVGLGGTRVEYWVVGLVDGRLVGAKALAIES